MLGKPGGLTVGIVGVVGGLPGGNGVVTGSGFGAAVVVVTGTGFGAAVVGVTGSGFGAEVVVVVPGVVVVVTGTAVVTPGSPPTHCAFCG